MPFVRTLPGSLPPRFAGARRAVASSGEGSIEVVVAERFALRLRGLAGLGHAALVPLLFPRCRSLHTFGMRTPIDVVWLDLAADGAGASVLGVHEALAPRRLARAPRRPGTPRTTAALELAPGDAGVLGLAPGSEVDLRSIAAPVRADRR